jgi:hypothetical protein
MTFKHAINLIHGICLTKNVIKNIPRWKFITRNKEQKILNQYISDFLNLDIFTASDNFITFLIGLSKEITEDLNIFLWYNDTLFIIEIPDDNESVTNIVYYTHSNRFEVWNKSIAYTIYRNNKINKSVNDIWEPLSYKIKETYIDIIIQLSERLY